MIAETLTSILQSLMTINVNNFTINKKTTTTHVDISGYCYGSSKNHGLLSGLTTFELWSFAQFPHLSSPALPTFLFCISLVLPWSLCSNLQLYSWFSAPWETPVGSSPAPHTLLVPFPVAIPPPKRCLVVPSRPWALCLPPQPLSLGTSWQVLYSVIWGFIHKSNFSQQLHGKLHETDSVFVSPPICWAYSRYLIRSERKERGGMKMGSATFLF